MQMDSVHNRRNLPMKTKPLTFLLSFTFLFLFSGSVYGDDFQDGVDATKRGDYETAYRLWLPLAEQGDADVQNFLGHLYSRGQGVRQDYQEAVKWYRIAAEQGIVEAQGILGQKYKDGQGVLQNYKEAVKWWKLAAENGDAISQGKLGLMYNNGQGVQQDYREAVRLYILAAEQGFAPAQNLLGIMYDKGQGVLQNYVLAHMWLNICGSSGNQNCVDYRHIVEKEMTPQQIEKAQEMARNWKPKK
jgi:uncharacterized protein